MGGASEFLDSQSRFAKASVVLQGTRECELVHRLADCERLWTVEHAIAFVRKRSTSPLLLQYGSDLTPLTTRQTYKQVADGCSVTRSGKASNEFLVQRLFLTDVHDESVTVLEKPWILRKNGLPTLCSLSETL